MINYLYFLLSLNIFILFFHRANATVQLKDGSGCLDASAIGEPAETILKYTAEQLMNFTKAVRNDYNNFYYII